ncbi:biopolymer transporter ExbD [Hydrogenimonas cancrithermarum]|uniref:Biopolymer transport protein ExbD-like 2 n=1 Tax=Hydrogenimonas cancrithermarum TaxID=2993563 RepID=A0ABN6WTS6_9BACT|nr:biopolymer transporter ExbD [Hydrogenimonas cancrithermarum]BDY12454.1 putative biopolymer transport protein ExbD-like 2 [Hydrogenimonas cancrithermarum]
MKIRKFDQINVLPFIDIMLVLLVIVLTSASFVSKGTIPVDLPEASGRNAPIEKMKNIVIDKNGNFYFEERKMDFEAFRKKILSLDPKKDALLIRSDAKSQFQNFVKVIDLLKSNGFEKVSIETKQ